MTECPAMQDTTFLIFTISIAALIALVICSSIVICRQRATIKKMKSVEGVPNMESNR